MTDRRLEIADRVTLVRARIADAARACGRNPGEITLVVITKTFPASDVRLLAELGLVAWGSEDQSERKAQVLTVLLDTPATQYDVSVPDRPTLRPVPEG